MASRDKRGGEACSAIGCTNARYKHDCGGLSFFRFPKDATRCKQWIQNTRREDLLGKDPKKLHSAGYVLCSNHFKRSQFLCPDQARKRLVWNAVPTVFDVPNPPPKLGSDRRSPKEMSSEPPEKQQRSCETVQQQISIIEKFLDVRLHHTLMQQQSSTMSLHEELEVPEQDAGGSAESEAQDDPNYITEEHAIWEVGVQHHPDACSKATQTSIQRPCVQDSLVQSCRAYPAVKMDLVKSDILTDTVQMQSSCVGEVAGTPPDTGNPSQDRRQTSVESLLKQRICPSTELSISCRLKRETDPVEDSEQSKSVFLLSKRSRDDQQSISTVLCPSNLHGSRRPQDSDEADGVTIKTEPQDAGEIWSVNSAGGGLASSTDENASNLQGSGRPQYNDEANTVTIKTEPQDEDEIWSVDSAEGSLTTTSTDENTSEFTSFADVSVKTESPVFPVALFQNIHSSEPVGSEVSITRMDCRVEPQSITAKRDPDNFSNRPVAEQPQISPRGDQLKSETKVHNRDKLYQCMVYPTSFKAIIDLKKGTDTLIGDDDECPECKRIYGSSRCLKIPHLKPPSDEKPFHCTQCSCAFPSRTLLKWHLRRHTGEKPYQCSVCQAKFSLSRSLNNHMKSHSGENLYSCSDCPAAFTTTSLLLRHRRRIHADKKPHKCSECLRAFEVPSHLKKHAKIHSGEKPYQRSGRKPRK